MGNLKLLMFLTHYLNTVGEEEDKHNSMYVDDCNCVCLYNVFVGNWSVRVFSLKMCRI